MKESKWEFAGLHDHANVCFEKFRCVECSSIYVNVKADGTLPKFCPECGLPMSNWKGVDDK